MNSTSIISTADRILVTGSNGFIGAKVVEILLEYGFANFRCFVRPSSKLDRLRQILEKYPSGKVPKLFWATCFPARISGRRRRAFPSPIILTARISDEIFAQVNYPAK
jgi:nucleoside-diphosphate-sugar epimerase